jgi:hypothetical protein
LPPNERAKNHVNNIEEKRSQHHIASQWYDAVDDHVAFDLFLTSRLLMPNPSLHTSDSVPALTDSPWFWVMLFCAVGSGFVLMMSPKYSKRQGRLELQYQAHQEKARRQFEGEGSTREPGAEGNAAPPPTDELIIPLGPLLTVFGLLFTVSAVQLWRTRRGFARHPTDKQTPGHPS